MKFLLAFVSIVALSLAIPAELTQQEWIQFKTVHNKQYKTIEEERHRYNIFLDNLRKVQEHNEQYEKGLTTYQKGVTVFSDWTREEFMDYVNPSTPLPPPEEPEAPAPRFQVKQNVKLASSFDWRDHGAVTPVKNQGPCENCWTFSATGAMEGINFIENGELLSLSEEELAECTYPERTSWCDYGGWYHLAWNYVRDHGEMLEKDYPYTDGVGRGCRFDPQKSVLTLSGYQVVDPGNETALLAAINQQPISIVIDATDNLQHYTTGIFKDPICKTNQGNHAVLAVGYGSEDGIDYWLIKNSWGDWWGEKGYVRMLRNGQNHCGVVQFPALPIL